ncbi:hypothetical protein V5O48_001143 [Marasmius crinis-equi]|uniref:F-box domain-containing protein n=1 Tax=Marasmius crinis-equi TaxID=585013 RepID=A0ABR3G0E5_9AGAR
MAFKSSISLPIEIAEQIISTLWLSPLTTSERIRLAESCFDVSHLWHSIFLRVAATDFYITNISQASQFLDVLRGKREMSSEHSLDLTGLCRSITIQHKHGLPGDPIGFVFRDIMDELARDTSDYPQRLQLPFLRRIALELQNDHVMESVFEGNSSLFSCVPSFSGFPQQLTELEINFSSGEDGKSTIKTRRHERSGLENGKRLAVLGTSGRVAKELLGVSGGSDELQLFSQDVVKDFNQQTAAAVEEAGVDDDSEEFFDAETGLDSEPPSHSNPNQSEPQADDGVDSWEDSAHLLARSFSKDELIRLCSAMEGRMVIS